MWEYPKSRLHQAAIDASKFERSLEAGRTASAQSKLRREQEAADAAKGREADKLAVLANTARLRAERLTREAEARAKGTSSGKYKRGN